MNAGSAPMSRALCMCRGANDARRRSLLHDAKPHNRWRPYAVAAGGVVEWKVRSARGLAAATWRKLNDRVLVVASTPFLTPRARAPRVTSAEHWARGGGCAHPLGFGGVVEWKLRLARGLAAATWRDLIDRVLVVASTPLFTPHARLQV